MKKTITWQKYEDYLEANMDASKNFLKSLDNTLNGMNNKNSDDFIDMEDDENHMSLLHIPVSEELLSAVKLANNFNCWFGHTNFEIRRSIKDLIETTDGVEILYIVSRYRFLMGVGNAFEFSSVVADLEQRLNNNE